MSSPFKGLLGCLPEKEHSDTGTRYDQPNRPPERVQLPPPVGSVAIQKVGGQMNSFEYIALLVTCAYHVLMVVGAVASIVALLLVL